MNRIYTNRRFLDAIKERILVFDGAMGTNLQTLNLTVDQFGGEKYYGCNDYLVISNPQIIEKIHISFLEAGVDVIETDTFRANRLTLADYGLQGKTSEINIAAARLAHRLAKHYSTPFQPRFIAGAIGPSGQLPSAGDTELSTITFDNLADIFREQAIGLIQGDVDLLLLETSQDILEVKAAIHGITLAFTETKTYLPVQVQITLDTSGRMLLGTDIGAALTILEGLPIDVLGLNCSTGPEHMREPLHYLSENSSLPIVAIPNAGLPLNINGEAVYPLQPLPFTTAMLEFIDKYNVNIVGGCCGTTPLHLKTLVESIHLKQLKPKQKRSKTQGCFSSAIQSTTMRQEPSPLLIGERCNAQGSREFKRILLSEDYDEIIALARQQVDHGAHALDISVAVTERIHEEKEMMYNVVRKLVIAGIHVPLVIDTTEPDVMEAALKATPGRCLLNSTHLEGGATKAEKVFALAKMHNAAVLLLTIDEEGMAKTIERKLAIAKRLYDLALSYDLKPQDLVYDALTFTLATGDPELADSAIATIESIQKIKQLLPGVYTSLGVSNVSFGLGKSVRPILNSVFLYHCVQSGLDMAIVNPAQVLPYSEILPDHRKLMEDLIFNRRENALGYVIDYYNSQNISQRNEVRQTTVDPMAEMKVEDRLFYRVLHRYKEGIELDIDELLSKETIMTRHESAVNALNKILLPAMKEVGDKFGSGELILPFVLQSAEVMKRAVAHLETYLDKAIGITKGTVVLATVYGDVHDIGKNLVKTILSNNGYTVIDLGKQVPIEVILDQAIAQKADAIGLSALLVSTSKQMPLVVNELQRRGLAIPVLIGGAAINRRFGYHIGFPAESGDFYTPGVFYCKDAFEGLDKMDRLMDAHLRPDLLKTLELEAKQEMQRANDKASHPKPFQEKLHSNITPARIIPKPPFLGYRVLKDIPLDKVFLHLFKNDLFRLSWGAKNAHGIEWEKLQDEFESRLKVMQRHAIEDDWLRPQAIYGFWQCQAQLDDLIIYHPTQPPSLPNEELLHFTFPRQLNGEYLCLADYFSSVDSNIFDCVAFQIVSVGEEASQRFETLQEKGDYAEAYFFHGFAVQTAEAMADYLHKQIRGEMGIPEGQGKRYSWGFPAIPDLEDHQKVFTLLPAERELGMMLTSAYELIPEQSTAAVIVHHPISKYFNVGESRLGQLQKP